MNGKKTVKDEYLEKLWYMMEEEKDSLNTFINSMNEHYDKDIIEELSSEGLIDLDEDGSKIILTQEGRDLARQLIRSHRLAERLVHDVLGREFEVGACEFEHIITPEIVDSICTLLGHPRECPHGMPIPEGECCKSSLKSAQSSVIKLTDLEVSQSARVAYVTSENDQQLHKIDCLHIRPGQIVKLHQTYPTYVIECENAHIALDEEIASNIYVWRDIRNNKPGQEATEKQCPGKGRRKRHHFFKFRNRGEKMHL